MLKGLSPPRQPALTDLELLRDPWSTPTIDRKVIAASQITEQPNLVEPSASLDYQRRLPAHQAIAQDLLEDELKLQANLSDPLKAGLEKAFALLYWLDREGHTT